MSATWSPPKGYENRPVAVLGGGVLGRRIACGWASAGYTVNIRDPSEQSRDDAIKYVNENIDLYAKATKRPGSKPAKAFAFPDMESVLKDAWIVFEAVPEKLHIKIDTFAELEKLAPQDCLLASNSSSYKSGEMLEKVNDETRRRILNTHYMMPPDNRIVELMTCGYTHEEIFPFLAERHRETGFSPYVAQKESTGFIFNRVWAAVKRECLTILAEGVSTPPQLDQIWMEMFGSKVGPCTMMDMVGLDTVAFIEEHYIHERGLSSEKTVDYLRENYLNHGKLGMKSDKGGLLPPRQAQPAQPAQPEQSKVLFLDVGLGLPIKDGLQKMFTGGKVMEMTRDGKNVRSLVDGLPLPDGIDHCTKDDRLYWTNMGIPSSNDGSVMSANRDGSDVRTIVPQGSVHTPKQISIDQASGKLYFCDREGLRVMRCNLDGSDLETIIQTGDWRKPEDKADLLKWCVGITVSPALGKFFWTQKGNPKSNQGRIFMANIDIPAGETAETRTDIECVVQGLPECIDLEFEESMKTLYWTDRGELPFGNTLNRVALDAAGKATAKHEIIAQKFDEAIGLKLDPTSKTVFVSDLGGTIWSCNYDGTEKKKVFENKEACFTGLTIV